MRGFLMAAVALQAFEDPVDFNNNSNDYFFLTHCVSFSPNSSALLCLQQSFPNQHWRRTEIQKSKISYRNQGRKPELHLQRKHSLCEELKGVDKYWIRPLSWGGLTKAISTSGRVYDLGFSFLFAFFATGGQGGEISWFESFCLLRHTTCFGNVSP